MVRSQNKQKQKKQTIDWEEEILRDIVKKQGNRLGNNDFNSIAPSRVRVPPVFSLPSSDLMYKHFLDVASQQDAHYIVPNHIQLTKW